MNRSGAPTRLRRAALLLAAALHLLGIAAGPALHGWLRADPHLAGWSQQREEQTLPAHDEMACVVCQASEGRALAEPSHVPAAAEAPASRPLSPEVSLPPAPARIRVQARAPPVSLV
ncbi:hypothetical protein [Longimicrobium sp.]|uniref:hypothetical protein n=1 Tax=Longimicrobium sp. TaxID=2029185 RepID=UPI002C0C0B3C|nr:hypothetical protein [Longimicrobium sp.]HSU12822.1 hypothetical protein [Longimicrobium sp.]